MQCGMSGLRRLPPAGCCDGIAGEPARQGEWAASMQIVSEEQRLAALRCNCAAHRQAWRSWPLAAGPSKQLRLTPVAATHKMDVAVMCWRPGASSCLG
jgi:hypothetical protein